MGWVTALYLCFVRARRFWSAGGTGAAPPYLSALSRFALLESGQPHSRMLHLFRLLGTRVPSAAKARPTGRRRLCGASAEARAKPGAAVSALNVEEIVIICALQAWQRPTLPHLKMQYH